MANIIDTIANYFRRITSRIVGHDFYVDTENHLRAARNIEAGETVTMTLEQYQALLKDVKNV